MANFDESSIPEQQPSGDIAIVGERDGRAVSYQMLQDIYNEITGKCEELNKGYELPFRIEMQDLCQLHLCIKQLCEQYQITSENESITVYHDEDTREVFSSFERFRMSDPSSLSPVESIFLKYNFLVILPKSKRPQSYSLSIRLASRVTIMRRLQEEMFAVPRIFRIMGGRTAMVTAQYVDYMVARNLLDGVDRWIKGLQNHEYPVWFKFMRRHSIYARHIATYSVGAASVFLVFRLIPSYVSASNPNFQSLVGFVLFGAVGIFGMVRLGRFFGTTVESALDESMELSYVHLNRGDAKRIADAEKQARWRVARAAASLVSAIVLGLLTSLIEKWVAA